MNYRFEELRKIVYQYEHLGIKKLPNGTILIGRAPHIAQHAWLNEIFPVITEKEIKEIENNIGIKIPEDYRQFLTEFSNGLTILTEEFSLYGYSGNRRTSESIWQPFDLVLYNTLYKPQKATPEMLIIGRFGWDNHKIAIMPDNSLLYADEDFEKIKPIDISFMDLLLTEIPRLYSMFDENGVCLDKNAPTTPIF